MNRDTGRVFLLDRKLIPPEYEKCRRIFESSRVQQHQKDLSGLSRTQPTYADRSPGAGDD